jgi:hypothetical protein
VRVNLRLARVDDTTLGIEGMRLMSDGSKTTPLRH